MRKNQAAAAAAVGGYDGDVHRRASDVSASWSAVGDHRQPASSN